jgi:hypothetical protein
MSKPDIAKSYAALADLAGDGAITIGASGPGLPPTQVTLTADMAPKFRQIAKRLRDMPADAQKGANPMVTAAKTNLTPVVSRDELYPVPQEGAFAEGIDFIDGRDIRDIAEDLIVAHRHIFGWLSDYVVLYRWRKVGGETAGKAKLGECKKANGHDRFLYGKKVHFFITLSADNIRDRQLTREQVEALIFHELNHASVSEKGKPIILPHEFEGFRSELEQYGPWSADLQRAEDGFQARMDLRADEADDEE